MLSFLHPKYKQMKYKLNILRSKLNVNPYRDPSPNFAGNINHADPFGTPANFILQYLPLTQELPHQLSQHQLNITKA